MFITFVVTYGLLEVVMDRWPRKFGSDWNSATDPTDIFGLGKLVPLLLLFLPVLSAIEVDEGVTNPVGEVSGVKMLSMLWQTFEF